MLKKLIPAVLLVVAIFTVIHFIIANSDGYEMAETFLMQSSDVQKEVGAISKLSLLPLETEVHDHGSSGDATYHVQIEGSKGVVTGVVSSTKTDGQWTIRKVHLIKEDKGIIILKE